MESDFSGYATKAGLRCSDGRTIMPDAFKGQDKARVPLVWQHGHTDPENVLGHAILENRADGVYCYGFFNKTTKATHAKGLLEHGDISQLSIWANQLVERSKMVLHGAIREVSLVLSGANPGALIENVTIRHSDGMDDVLEDEAVIFTGLEFEHSESEDDDTNENDENDDDESEMSHADDDDDSDDSDDDDDEETVKDVYESMSEKQKNVLHFMLGEAVEAANKEADAKHDSIAEHYYQEGANDMKHNVFESESDSQHTTISHDDLQAIVSDATKNGSLKDAVEGYALQHGIEDIDVLFPEAKAIAGTPEFLSRRMEWVNKVIGATRKSPFSRIKTLSADITVDQARAKGYIKGDMKKEEFFSVAKRVTTPTTIYKKQKLDRDDMVDITDFDVIMWLKGEMRVMLDEEIARAILVGDGRDISDEDKINEQNVRPVAKDHELFTTQVNVNIDDASSSVQEIIDAIVSNRRYLKGTGQPTMYTTEEYVSRFLLLKDTVGRRIYKTLEELAAELRVAEIVPVEVMEEYDDIVAVLVNPADYVLGADKGGAVSMFDDFDIDYNQYKYLIETRLSGCLVRLKSAMVINKVAASLVAVTPEVPTFVEGTGVVTIPSQTGVVYKDASDDSTLSAGAQTAIDLDEVLAVYAVADTGYYLPTNQNDEWTFTGVTSL